MIGLGDVLETVVLAAITIDLIALALWARRALQRA